MSRRYYKRNNDFQRIIILVIAAIVCLALFWKFILLIALIAGGIAALVFFIKTMESKSNDNYSSDGHDNYPNRKTNQYRSQYKDPYKHKEPNKTQEKNEKHTNEQPSYQGKTSIMTDCEKEFFKVFNEILGDKFIIQPQINLASIVKKESHSKYRNELFRNIDFGVFDQNYNLKLLIEINDRTHESPDRIERDKKVRAICEEAGITLITFWTKYGINREYIHRRLHQYLTICTTEETQETPLHCENIVLNKSEFIENKAEDNNEN